MANTFGKYAYATRHQYLDSTLPENYSSANSVLTKKHNEIYQRVHKENIEQKCREMENQLNTLFFSKGSSITTKDGITVEQEEFYKLLEEIFYQKYPTYLIDQTKLNIGKTRISELNPSLAQETATLFNQTVRKKNNVTIDLNLLNSQVTKLGELIDTLATGNEDLVKAYAKVQNQLLILSAAATKQGNKIISNSKSTNAINEALQNYAKEKGQEVRQIGNELGQDFISKKNATAVAKQTILSEEIDDLYGKLTGGKAVSNTIIGDILEYSGKIAGLLILGKSYNEVIEMMKAGTEGAEKAIPIYDKTALPIGTTITLSGGQQFDAVDGSMSVTNGDETYYITYQSGTQNKVDISIDYQNTAFDMTAKNYNLKKTTWLTVLGEKSKTGTISGTSLYQFLSNEDTDYFISHYINLTKTSAVSQNQFNKTAPALPEAKSANLAIQKIVLWKAFTGMDVLKNFEGTVRAMNGANVFLFNDNSRGKIFLMSTAAVFDKLFASDELSNLVRIVGFPLSTGYWGHEIKPTHEGNPDLFERNADSRQAFLNDILSQLANFKLMVSFNLRTMLS